MMSLRNQRILVVGRGTGIARAVALRALAEGAEVIVAGRDREALAAAYAEGQVTAEFVDLTDDESIARLARRIGRLDHVVSTASARARGELADLTRSSLMLSLDTKVLGPIMLAQQIAPQMNPEGSIVLFSGANAYKVNVGYLGVAVTNGAVDFLTRSLAVELAPIRVNAISPGVVDTGAWDALGPEGKRSFFERKGSASPSGRIGTVEDIAHAALFAMTNTFMTGTMLKIDGGEPLV
jgi:NAD(P)-dependent dehydrogenase (short-subunit alcohol dehydrogenase family)